jgi:hypothetical protein
VASAWGYAHDSGRSDAEYFDTKHMDEWKACIGDIRRMGLYQKYLPYQLDALNESGPAELRTTEYSGKYLPSGMTIDDFGFGILRKDGKTPRPT